MLAAALLAQLLVAQSDRPIFSASAEALFIARGTATYGGALTVAGGPSSTGLRGLVRATFVNASESFAEVGLRYQWLPLEWEVDLDSSLAAAENVQLGFGMGLHFARVFGWAKATLSVRMDYWPSDAPRFAFIAGPGIEVQTR